MNQHNVTSVSGFLQIVEQEKKAEEATGNNEDFLFRGQREDKKLLPRLGRLVPRGQRRDIELLMFNEFKRTSLTLLSLQPHNDWDFLAVAQHFGLPTRLLDWTYSALAALWFAVEREPAKVNDLKQNGVVWILKTQIEDFADETACGPFDVKTTAIYRPRVITQRIVAQAGVFTVHHVKESEGIVVFETNKRFKGRLLKCVVDGSSFAQIRKQVNACGVNRSTLFPDLAGLCDHLTWRYTRLPDEYSELASS